MRTGNQADHLFQDKKNWVSAIQASSMHQGEGGVPEDYLRRADLRVHDPYTSMPFSDAIFKEKCKSKYGVQTWCSA